MARSRTEEAPARRPILALACWTGLFAFYELLAGSPSGPEVVAGGLASLAATIAVLVSGSVDHLGRMRWGWWWPLIRRVASQVVGDTLRVLAAAIRPSAPTGHFRDIPFDPGGDVAVSGSRRALVILAASIAPNSYVVTIDRDHDRLQDHELVPRPTSQGHPDPRWPI